MGSALFLSNLRSQPLKTLLTRGYKEWFDRLFKVRLTKRFGELPSPVRVCVASVLMSLVLTAMLSIGFPRLSGRYFDFIDTYRLIRQSDELELETFTSLFILSLVPFPILLFGNAAFDYVSISKSYRVGAAMVGQKVSKIVALLLCDVAMTFILAVIALYSLYYGYLAFYVLLTSYPFEVAIQAIDAAKPYESVWPVALHRDGEPFGAIYPDRFATQAFWTTLLSAIWFAIFALPYALLRASDAVQGVEGRLLNKGIIGACAVCLFSFLYWIAFLFGAF